MVDFFAWLGRKNKANPNINSLRFDTSGWELAPFEQNDDVRRWRTPETCGAALYFENEKTQKIITTLETHINISFRNQLNSLGGDVVEYGIVDLGLCQGIEVITKEPQEPHGMTYRGVIVIPFRDFSFRILVYSPEIGTTGLREATLFAECAEYEEPCLDGSKPFFQDWNPDSSEHDSKFPMHPISRLRRVLNHIKQTAVFDEEIRKLPRFPLPK